MYLKKESIRYSSTLSDVVPPPMCGYIVYPSQEHVLCLVPIFLSKKNRMCKHMGNKESNSFYNDKL